ncbi:tyrosine-protein phosphatase [Propionibacterium sp.]|uniref:tyrosine-protein phosphatase n=1 Tax=Propionibacterium sp. TaxID=1977903 RepID=UPI0039E8068A
MYAEPYTPHWIDLEGVCNLRGLCGLPAAGGRTIAPRTLLRSDNLSDLTPGSTVILRDEYGLTDVVDLRTDMEIHETGQGPLSDDPGVSFHDFSLYPKEVPGQTIPPWMKDKNLHTVGTPVPRAQALSIHYMHYLSGRPDSVTSAMRTIATAQGATLVNCAAGKDRTGTVIAVVLSAVGVDRETIVADYEASNLRVLKIIDRLGCRIADAGSVHRNDNLTVHGQSTPAEAMQGLFALVDDHYGSMNDYLDRAGWTADDQQALETKLLG